MPINDFSLSPEEQVLIGFVRDEPLAPILALCDPDKLSRLAVFNKIIAPLASRISYERGMPFPWLRWAAIATITAEREARRAVLATQKTIRLLNSGGISPIVLKGISLSLGKERDAGDIDLLIPEDSLLKAISLLEEAGYQYYGFARNMLIRNREYRDWKSLARWCNQFEFLEPDTRALIELHTAFFETERVYAEDLSKLRAAVNEFIASSVVDADTGYLFLALEDRALLLALHASLKRSPANSEFILRHITDMRNLIDAGLDWEKLRTRALRFSTVHQLVFLLRLMERIIGPCAPLRYIEGLESQLPPGIVWLQRLHARCLKGLNSYSKSAIFAYRLVSPFILHGTPHARLRSLLIFPLLFPPSYSLAKVYGLPPRSPLKYLLYLLEPARWLRRLLLKSVRLVKKP